MKLILLASAAALALAMPAAAQVQEQTTTVVKEKPSAGAAGGAVAGAATGAVVGGPVGAAVGAVVGAVTGAVADPPTEVRTYVTRQNVPPVTYGRPIVMGQPLAGEISWLDIPEYSKYRWAYVDGRRVVVERGSGKVVAVYAADPPAGVRTYVTTQTIPEVKYGRQIVVGRTLDGDITWREVPSYKDYRWAYVDGRRVVVDAATGAVVTVY